MTFLTQIFGDVYLNDLAVYYYMDEMFELNFKSKSNLHNVSSLSQNQSPRYVL